MKLEIPQLTSYGDIWQLGDNNLLLCADCTNSRAMRILMGGEQADLVFTSPPYDRQRSYGGLEFDWTDLMAGMTKALILKEDGQLLVNLGLVHEQGEWKPYWEEWIENARTIGYRRFAWYIWNQGEGLPGDWNGRLAPCFEFVFHFNKRSRTPNKIVPCKSVGQKQHGPGIKGREGVAVQEKTHAGREIQPFKIPNAVINQTREQRAGLPTQHPAVFPVGLPRFIMEAFSQPGELIVDPMAGSGTTLLAGEECGRKVRAMEINPEYCDIALERYSSEYGEVKRLGNILRHLEEAA